jgi:hypothetical protein
MAPALVLRTICSPSMYRVFRPVAVAFWSRTLPSQS